MRAAAAILAFALLVASGCGEKRETTTGGESATGSAPAAVTVSETEFKLSPASLDVAQEGKVTVEVKNEGGTDHALEIDGPDGEVKTPALAPGKSATLEADLKAGTYEMYCPIDGHRGKGMKGELVVGGGGGTSTDDNGGSEDNGGSDDNGGGGGGSGGY